MLLARRRPFPSAARRADTVAAFALGVIVVVSLVWHATHNGEPAVLLLIPPALVAIVLRRSRTEPALLLAVAVAAALPDNRALVLPVMAVLFTIAGQAPWRRAAVAAAAASAVAIVTDAAWGSGTESAHGGLLGYAVGSAATYAAAVGVGLYVGARRRVLDGLRDRAERLDRERELLADRAVAEERVRIAQELHDIVAHNVSLMVVQAQALGATVPDDKVVAGTDAIADLGRQAMTEMHTTLRLLRADGETPELSPQPGLDQLERLLEQLRQAGLEVELTIEGRPRPLPQAVDLSAFRIVQEALTNVVKHASGARTRVTLAYKDEGIELTVLDTEDEPRTIRVREPSDGHGVIGMRERAALFDGTLSAESVPGGFKVTATLPYAPAAS
jgi:signal transduction histidine kinase